jgi:hypothetical protein
VCPPLFIPYPSLSPLADASSSFQFSGCLTSRNGHLAAASLFSGSDHWKMPISRIRRSL